MSRTRLWIIDGHNVIFAIPDLERLQVGGRGEEARRVLEERLELFALQRQERVLLVFDSAERASGRSAARTRHFEVVFARGRAGAADNYIVCEARRRSDLGLPVAVVTNDLRTLANRLPKGVRRLDVRGFWLAHVEPRPGAEDKQIVGDFSDLEREMLAQAAASERPMPARQRAPLNSPSPSPRDARRDLLHQKRERGRRRHERRLKLRTAR
jgi:predicted RNA-binding protein with PIN domain